MHIRHTLQPTTIGVLAVLLFGCDVMDPVAPTGTPSASTASSPPAPPAEATNEEATTQEAGVEENPEPQFGLAAARAFETAAEPVAVAATSTDAQRATAPLDLNGDGFVDLATANEGSNKVSVLLNQGFDAAGEWLGLAPSLDFQVADGPVAIAAADFDRDGDIDLATAGILSGVMSVLLNKGDGTFDAAMDSDPGSALAGIAAGDLDGDGWIDLVVTDEGADEVLVFINAGEDTHGQWSFRDPTPFPIGTQPRGIVMADLDGDGAPDLAVSNIGNEPSVAILFNNGTGGFDDPPVVYTDVGNEPFHLAAARLNGDDPLDLAVVDAASFAGSTGLTLLMNDGTGGFTKAEGYLVGEQPRAVVCADLDGDGLADLSVANRASDSISILLNEGGGLFADAVSRGVGERPGGITTVDLDHDGRPDVVTADQVSGSVSVLLNETTP